MIAGVDGCKEKWIAVVDKEDGQSEVREPCTFRELINDRGLDLIVIDVPIGLKDAGSRCADVTAREFLRKRGCCIFTAPIRPLLRCQTYPEACDTRFRIERKKISKQTFAILPKVKGIDDDLRRGTVRSVREGHPEVSFALMNGGVPLLSKKKPKGVRQRLKLLRDFFPDIRAGAGTSNREDILDAYALLWTARRIVNGEERKFPHSPQFDQFGLRMEIAA
jgi:predicted RNase H-like nuclease